MAAERGSRSPRRSTNNTSSTRRKTAQPKSPDAQLENLPAAKRRTAKHCNQLDGKRWLQNSISVWSDIRKTAEEARLGHPALFPQMLVERLIETFLPIEGRVILDPFAGSGSTIVAAQRLGKQGIGFELSPEYAALAERRLNELGAGNESATRTKVGAKKEDKESMRSRTSGASVVHNLSATGLRKHISPNSVDLCITSPPYWNILNQRRTADMKQVRHYGNLRGDLGTIESYEDFLQSTTNVLSDVLAALVPGAYCCVIVMDLRKKNRFFPLHSDLATRLVEAGYIFDDLIIWNRQSEYNNLRPLGYPAVFRVNKVHEFVLLLQKPRS